MALKNIVSLFAILAGAAVASPLLAFDLDVSRSQINEAFNRITVADLRVGETALVRQSYGLCRRDRKLFFWSGALLGGEPGRFEAIWQITLQPGGQLSVALDGAHSFKRSSSAMTNFALGQSIDRGKVQSQIRLLALHVSECSKFKAKLDVTEGDFLEIVDINGFRTLSELLGELG